MLLRKEVIIKSKTTKEKISFFSAMMIVFGGAIGAGIFFKAKSVINYSHGSLILAIFSWIIAAVAIITMALALIEISSIRNDNLSFVGWNKVFNSRTIYKAAKNFVAYICIPLTFFFMPIYAIISLQSGIGLLSGGVNTFNVVIHSYNIDWIIWTLISLVITSYYIIVPAIFTKLGNIQNIITTSIKFIPVILIIIIGFTLMVSNNIDKDALSIATNTKYVTNNPIDGISSFENIGAVFGVFLSIAGIFFAYDGFFVVSGISTEMKHPKKAPMALLIGLIITTVIYLLIAISLSITGGDLNGIQPYLNKLLKSEYATNIILGIINIMLSIGVLGILNGFSLWGPRYIENLLSKGELPFWKKAIGKLNFDKPWYGVKYILKLTIPIVIIFSIIGVLGYAQIGQEGQYWYYKDGIKIFIYGSEGMTKLIVFSDLIGNWTALFTFVFIGFSITGAIKNRIKKKDEIKHKTKYFMSSAIISVAIVFLSSIVIVIAPIIDLFLLINTNPSTEIIISKISLVVVLLIYIGLSFIPTEIENYFIKKRFITLKEYRKWKWKLLSENQKHKS
ncbi:amino acid permease [Mycoplasma phocimorsus]|uniref:amino acid permease n=1 Tax=Mycoplasma phocimorsus TaxID=3045839 RepID=UPI00322016D5